MSRCKCDCHGWEPEDLCDGCVADMACVPKEPEPEGWDNG